MAGEFHARTPLGLGVVGLHAMQTRFPPQKPNRRRVLVRGLRFAGGLGTERLLLNTHA